MSTYHIGDTITQSGHNNRMEINRAAQQNPEAALREMAEAVHALRSQLAPTDRQTLDESMNIVSTGTHAEKGALRRALSSIGGVAAVVGQVGVPVVETIRRVTAALGL